MSEQSLPSWAPESDESSPVLGRQLPSSELESSLSLDSKTWAPRLRLGNRGRSRGRKLGESNACELTWILEAATSERRMFFNPGDGGGVNNPS
jgi:hypothetical protein